jgi:hypothetical protein
MVRARFSLYEEDVLFTEVLEVLIARAIPSIAQKLWQRVAFRRVTHLATR